MALVAHSETVLRDFNRTGEKPVPHLCVEPGNINLGPGGLVGAASML